MKKLAILLLFTTSMFIIAQAQNKMYDNKNSHNWIDLGLSVKWATCNIGVFQPEDYGDYFAWGEISGYFGGKTDFSNYKYWHKDISYHKTLIKYCNNSSYGFNNFTDNKLVLEPEDDAAVQNWGKEWHIPTAEEWIELRENCTWEWTDNYDKSGISGYIVTSNKSGYTHASIFLPAAGYRYLGLKHSGYLGYYWSSSINEENPSEAVILVWNRNKNEDFVGIDIGQRYHGGSIRPVCQ